MPSVTVEITLYHAMIVIFQTNKFANLHLNARTFDNWKIRFIFVQDHLNWALAVKLRFPTSRIILSRDSIQKKPLNIDIHRDMVLPTEAEVRQNIAIGCFGKTHNAPQWWQSAQ